MREAGVEVEIYNVVEFYDLDRINNRTHRKLLVVDGRIGFTGGVGIADEWNGHAQSPAGTGATGITKSRGRSSRRCRARSWTTG